MFLDRLLEVKGPLVKVADRVQVAPQVRQARFVHNAHQRLIVLVSLELGLTAHHRSSQLELFHVQLVRSSVQVVTDVVAAIAYGAGRDITCQSLEAPHPHLVLLLLLS